MRKLILALSFLATAPAWALEGPAPVAVPPATSASAPTPAQTGNSKKVQLGKIEVTGMKPLVEALQEVKVAVKRPFDNDPAHFDQMVCRLDVGRDTGYRAQGGTLECGTQGWFSMRRNAYMFGSGGPGAAAVSTLGHPWHTVRALNMKQLQTMREILKELPPPGQGDVQVMDDGQHAPVEPSH